MSSPYPTADDEDLKVNVLEQWPADSPSSMDASQIKALKCVLKRRLATVRDSPETGKIYEVAIALSVLLENSDANQISHHRICSHEPVSEPIASRRR